MNADVAVVGGGWAGCAAALTLAEAGVRVTLFEASRTPGGRARGVRLDGRQVDNGQHLLVGAYRSCLDIIARVRPARAGDDLWRRPLRLEAPPGFCLNCPPLPAPLHLLTGLATARGLNWREKLAALRWASSQLRPSAATGDSTVSVLTRTQPARVNRLLWHPLCISALNTPPESASAHAFLAVLKGLFGGSRRDSDFLLPRCDLTTLFPAPAIERILALGNRVLTGTRVRTIEAAAGSITLRLDENAQTYSHVVVAVAPQHLHALTEYVRELDTARRQVGSYRYLPIATGYVQVDPAFRLPQPLLALPGGPAQFVFDRGQSHAQPGLLALVASAAEPLPEDWLTRAEAQLHGVIDSAPARWRRAIIEKQATYACVPGLPRPAVRTPHPRLFLAGDYTEGPYPATLETAVSSGVQSAQALLASL